MVKENRQAAQRKIKSLYDRRGDRREFSPGEVLALLPLACSPLQAKFPGPYTVA